MIMNVFNLFSSSRKTEEEEQQNIPDEEEEDEPSIYFDAFMDLPVDAGRSLIFP